MIVSIKSEIQEVESQAYLRQKLSLDNSIRICLNSNIERDLCTNIRDNLHSPLFWELIRVSPYYFNFNEYFN